ncbi:hypothetical protein SZMC14600_13855 [Saccharomonospora azurea SZMC 14600]|nr:hypothetical protein SZMC14600_13855 [Saccharomonospora azurea SZMC 14600]
MGGFPVGDHAVGEVGDLAADGVKVADVVWCGVREMRQRTKNFVDMAPEFAGRSVVDDRRPLGRTGDVENSGGAVVQVFAGAAGGIAELGDSVDQ